MNAQFCKPLLTSVICSLLPVGSNLHGEHLAVGVGLVADVHNVLHLRRVNVLVPVNSGTFLNVVWPHCAGNLGLVMPTWKAYASQQNCTISLHEWTRRSLTYWQYRKLTLMESRTTFVVNTEFCAVDLWERNLRSQVWANTFKASKPCLN